MLTDLEALLAFLTECKGTVIICTTQITSFKVRRMFLYPYHYGSATWDCQSSIPVEVLLCRYAVYSDWEKAQTLLQYIYSIMGLQEHAVCCSWHIFCKAWVVWLHPAFVCLLQGMGSVAPSRFVCLLQGMGSVAPWGLSVCYKAWAVWLHLRCNPICLVRNLTPKSGSFCGELHCHVVYLLALVNRKLLIC